MISDCDEIVRPEALTYMRESNHNYYGIVCPFFYFKFNYLNTSSQYNVWPVAYRNALNMKPSSMRRSANEIAKPKPPDSILVHHGGWHFSWIGDDESVKNKLKSFSHTEYNTPEIINNINVDMMIEEKTDHVSTLGAVWDIVKMDNYFPEYVMNNYEKYKKYICDGGQKTAAEYYEISHFPILEKL